jgi:hypothetical protein
MPALLGDLMDVNSNSD